MNTFEQPLSPALKELHSWIHQNYHLLDCSDDVLSTHDLHEKVLKVVLNESNTSKGSPPLELMPNLEYLIVDFFSKEEYSGLDDLLPRLPKLKKLRLIDWNPNASALACLPFLQIKDLSIKIAEGCGFPLQVFDMPVLESLSIQEQELETIPDLFDKLPMLTQLSLDTPAYVEITNSINTCHDMQLPGPIHSFWSEQATIPIPASVFTLRGLKSLELLTLSPFTAEYQRFEQLESLHLWAWEKDYPEQVQAPKLPSSAFPNLKRIHIHGDYTRDLFSGFGHWEQIEELSIMYSDLSILPFDPTRLRSLRQLSINHCGLEILPDWVLELNELIHLNLDYNRIQSLPDALLELPQVQSINALDNSDPNLNSIMWNKMAEKRRQQRKVDG